MSAPDRINPEYLRSLALPPKSKHVTLGYRISRRVHNLAFQRGKRLYGLLAEVFAGWDKTPSWLSRFSYWLERQSKHFGYGCQDCGDCSLPDTAYLCPLASCPKHTRNGPCGGSAEGRCELLDRECFWARVYERLKHYRESEGMTKANSNQAYSGGVPITQQYADEIGADGYSDNASAAVALARRLARAA